MQLVPPTLRVLARLITYNIPLQYAVTMMENYCYMGRSYAELQTLEYPPIKIATRSLGHGLVCSYTETAGPEWERRGLVWVTELACHNLCAIVSRECQVPERCIDTSAWMQKIYKKHNDWLDKIPSV